MSDSRTRFGAVFLAAVVVVSLLAAGAGPVAGTGVEAPDERTQTTQGTTQDSVSVGLIGDTYLGQIESTLSEELSSEYTLEEVTSVSDVDNYDVIVVETLAPVDGQAFYEKTNTADIGVVYLDQWGNDANSIPEIAQYDDSIGTAWQNDAYEGDAVPPVSFEVNQSHPILDGFSEGDEILIHEGEYADHSWFEQSGLDVLATVTHDDGAGGTALAVEEDTNTVFAATLGYSEYVQPSDFTDDATTILGNAVEYAVPDSEPPSFVIDDSSVPAEGEPGQTVTAEATVTNDGGESGDATVTFAVGGQSVEETVTLDAGQSKTVQLDATLPNEGGSYDWTLSTADDEVTGSIDVAAGAPAAFQIDNVVIPNKTEVGTTVPVDIEITNVGDQYGEKEVVFEFDGEEVGRDTFGLEGGESMVVSTQVTVPADPETYEWRAIAGDNQTTGTLEVVGPEPAAFDVSNVIIPEKADPGETVEVSIEVTNVGETYGEKEVAFEFAGEEVGSSTFGIQAGAGTLIYTNVTVPEDPGNYEWTAIAGDNESTGTLEVINDSGPATFTIDDVDGPVEGTAGDSVTFSATVTNTGQQSGETNVTLVFDGETFEKTVSLDAGYTEIISFEVTLPRNTNSESWTISTLDDERSGSVTIREPAPASFTIDGVSAPSTANTSESVTVDATVTNTGEKSGQQTVTFTLGGQTVEQTVSLNPGETKAVTFQVTTPNDVGSYEWSVETPDDETTGTLDITAEPNEATFVVEGVTAPSAGNTSETVTVEATIDNIGDVSGEASIDLWLDGDIVGTETVTLDGGESQTVTVEMTLPDEDGSYTWTVATGDDQQSDSIDVTDAPTPATFSVESAGAPGEADPGATVTVETTITNTGDESGEASIDVWFDGEIVETKRITLDAGASKTLAVEVSVPEESGSYTWTVATGDDQQSDSIDVVGEGDPPEFTVDEVDAPSEADAGAEITLTATVSNVGGQEGTEDVTLTVAGETVSVEDVTLPGGDSQTVEFDVTVPEEAGTYDWAVSVNGTERSGELTVEREQEPIQVDIGDATITSGETTSVRITTIGENVAGYDVTLTFDPDVVQVTSVDAGDIDGVSVDIDNEAGTVDISAGQESGLTDPLLAVVQLEAVASADSSTSLAFGSTQTFLDDTGGLLPADIDAGSVTVEPETECELGDVNGDGAVDAADATLLQRYIAGYDVGPDFTASCGDLDGDGEVTTADVVALLNKIVEVE